MAALGLALAPAAGCSSAGDEDAELLTSGGADRPDRPGTDTYPQDDDAGDTDGDQGGGSSGGASESGDDGQPEPPPSGDDDGTFAPCPQPLPGPWVFCEDFETIGDPSEVMLDYQSNEGAFELVDEIGASGTHAMEVRYREGEEAAGRMVLSFGASPIDDGGRPTYAPESDFQEIYWRLRIKTEPGWPDIGPGQLTRTVTFASQDWSEAVVAHLRAPAEGVVLEGVPSTCVYGNEIGCTGFDDTNGLESLGGLAGHLPLFSKEESGRWHCVEGHLVLNTPGVADGVFEFWVDDELQAGREDLDLRGSWADYGINAVVVENLWPGGAPAPLRRWIDDLVISTEPIGCLPGPSGASPS